MSDVIKKQDTKTSLTFFPFPVLAEEEEEPRLRSLVFACARTRRGRGKRRSKWHGLKKGKGTQKYQSPFPYF